MFYLVEYSYKILRIYLIHEFAKDARFLHSAFSCVYIYYVLFIYLCLAENQILKDS